MKLGRFKRLVLAGVGLLILDTTYCFLFGGKTLGAHEWLTLAFVTTWAGDSHD